MPAAVQPSCEKGEAHGLQRHPLMNKTIAAVAVFAALTAGFSLEAKEKSQPSGAQAKLEKKVSELKSACESDLNTYCKDVTAGEGRIAACLDSHEDQLSADCKGEWVSTKARVSERVDKAEVAFRKSCGKDVQKFCADVPSGRGRILECLADHESELSGSCQDFHASLEKRLSELVG